MATIATDGKGNYVTLDAGGNWVPTAAPAPTKQGGGELGYQAAPPETKLRSTDIGDITASHPGETDTPGWMSSRPVVDTSISGGGLGDPGTLSGAVAEGWRGGPRIVPQSAIEQAEKSGPLGYYVNSPLMQFANAPLRAANALFGGLQAAASGVAEPIGAAVKGPGLGRDVAALPEAFPTGDVGLPSGPRSFTEARAGSQRGNLQVGASNPPPVTANELMGAINRVPDPPVSQSAPPPQPSPNRLTPNVAPDGTVTPPAQPQPAGTTAPGMPNLPPVPDGYVRLYHGGANPTSGGARWVTPDYAYARDYREGQPVSYVDVPQDHPAVQDAIASHPDEPVRIASFNAPEDIAAQLRPVDQPRGGAQPTGATSGWRPVAPNEVFQPGRQFRMNQTTGQSEVFEPAAAPAAAPTPPASASDIPLTAEQILARSKSWVKPADEQAAQGAMINPGPSNGIRSVLTDAVPADPQTAIAKGSTPLTQLGKDYAGFQDQPMEFATVMQLDRRLTAEKRTAMRSDPNLAREIGEAQDKIRDKMQTLGPNDTTGDPAALAGLQQFRQGYTQYIKESQLDDIRYGASLVDPAKQDAYVRSRTAALLKSDASRNWTPDERAAAENAATMGVRGFIGNTAISVIKPTAAFLGFKVGGPAGAWVGGNMGEAAQAMARDALARRRPDRLGPVSNVITQGVPPENVLSRPPPT